jgi:eukaryotic-like serine/threonine-protein kinase
VTLDDQGIPTAPLGSRYRLDRRIGSGGMAEVFAATDLVLERTVAVKRLSRALVGDAVAHRRLQREARALASTHDLNIVAVFDVGEDQDGPYLVMELVEGTTLRVVLDREVRLEPARGLAIAAAIAQGLAAVHAHGVVHRDVKPSNVFLTGDDRVKIGDFGIARIAEGVAVTRSGEVLGSAPYVAPEQVTGGHVGPAADLYGLGCIVFEMLAGRPPFEGDDPLALAYSHVHEDPPRLDAVTPEIPVSVAGLVDRLLAKDPRDRPASADDARLLLVEAAASLQDRVPDEAMTAPLQSPTHAGDTRTERLERHPTTPLPPPAPGFTAPLPPPVLLPTGPPPSPAADGEPIRLKPWLLWAAGGIALVLVFVLLAGLFRGDRRAGVQDRASVRSPTTTPSTPASLTPATAGAALVDLANRLAAEGKIGQDIASAVQHTVDDVLNASAGGEGDQDKTLERLDGLNEKINEGLDKGHVASDAARSLHQAIEAFAKTVAPAGD